MRRRFSAGGLLAALAAAGLPAQAIEFSYSGYVREHLSVNLQDAPEPNYPVRSGEFFGLGSRVKDSDFEALGGQGELSMARTTLKLDGLLDLGLAQVVGVGRVVREHHTQYERRLQRAAQDNPIPLYDGGLALVIPGGPVEVASARGAAVAGEIARDGASPAALAALLETINASPDELRRVAGTDFGLHGGTFFEDYDSEELRELFVQFDIGKSHHFRLGRQQVVWGVQRPPPSGSWLPMSSPPSQPGR